MFTYWTQAQTREHQVQNLLDVFEDCTLLNTKWQNSAKNTEACSTVDMNSDHRIISTKIKPSRKCSKRHKVRRPNWQTIAVKPAFMSFVAEAHNRFEVLLTKGTESENAPVPDLPGEALSREPSQGQITMPDILPIYTIQNPDHFYEAFTKAVTNAASNSLPTMPKRRREDFSEGVPVREARKQRNTMRKQARENPADEKLKEDMKAAKFKLAESCRNEMEKHVNEVAKQVESATLDGRCQMAWQAANRLSGRKARKVYKIKGFNTIKARLNGWKTYFEKLLGSNDEGDNDNFVRQTIVDDELLINDKPITLSKLNNALKSLKTDKSAGSDAVPGILLRGGGLHDILLPLMNHTLETGTSPQAWTTTTIVPIPKSGDLSMMTNHRDVILMIITAKVYSRILLHRIRPEIKPHLRKEQSEFRPGRSTIQHILALRRVIEGAKHKNLPCVLSFIDFRKAFDSINRD